MAGAGDKDTRVARMALRLHVGAEGDPLDNEILQAWEALPDSSIIRNDWLRRRLVIGHILEREGLTSLLAVIGDLSRGVTPAVTARAPEPPAPRIEMPVFDDGPAPEISSRASAPAPATARAGNAKKKVGGLMPILPADMKPKPAGESTSGKDERKEDRKDEAGAGDSSPTAARQPAEPGAATPQAADGESGSAEAKLAELSDVLGPDTLAPAPAGEGLSGADGSPKKSAESADGARVAAGAKR